MSDKTKILLTAIAIFIIGIYLEKNGHLNWLKVLIDKASKTIDRKVMKHIREAYESLNL